MEENGDDLAGPSRAEGPEAGAAEEEPGVEPLRLASGAGGEDVSRRDSAEPQASLEQPRPEEPKPDKADQVVSGSEENDPDEENNPDANKLWTLFDELFECPGTGSCEPWAQYDA